MNTIVVMSDGSAVLAFAEMTGSFSRCASARDDPIRDSTMGMAKTPAALLSGRAFRAAVLGSLLTLVSVGSAGAQELQDNDYYSVSRTERGADLLRSVEKYHIGPAEEEMRARRWVAARGDIDFILRAFPNHPQALLLMVQLCAQWKSRVCTDDLPTRFDKAIAINPRAPGTFIVLGIAQQRTGAITEAIKSYQQALKLDPNSVNAHYNLGLAYVDTKQYDLANVHAQEAYRRGSPLPGLRDKLTKTGRWDPTAQLPPPSTEAAASPVPAETDARKAAPPK